MNRTSFSILLWVIFLRKRGASFCFMIFSTWNWDLSHVFIVCPFCFFSQHSSNIEWFTSVHLKKVCIPLPTRWWVSWWEGMHWWGWSRIQARRRQPLHCEKSILQRIWRRIIKFISSAFSWIVRRVRRVFFLERFDDIPLKRVPSWSVHSILLHFIHYLSSTSTVPISPSFPFHFIIPSSNPVPSPSLPSPYFPFSLTVLDHSHSHNSVVTRGKLMQKLPRHVSFHLRSRRGRRDYTTPYLEPILISILPVESNF